MTTRAVFSHADGSKTTKTTVTNKKNQQNFKALLAAETSSSLFHEMDADAPQRPLPITSTRCSCATSWLYHGSIMFLLQFRNITGSKGILVSSGTFSSLSLFWPHLSLFPLEGLYGSGFFAEWWSQNSTQLRPVVMRLNTQHSYITPQYLNKRKPLSQH